ncbi:hypothetical protein ACFC96_40785 [Streptomyces sp. NPDC055955]|uniref:hypothetical protein n=1 Tax=Streptomyces sp. NPDC055955 TaxID=3345665 RepID=UPI0035DDCC96
MTSTFDSLFSSRSAAEEEAAKHYDDAVAGGAKSGATRVVTVSDPVPAWLWPVILGALAVLVLLVVWASIRLAKARLAEAAEERRVLESAADRLREKMELPSIVDFNRILLERYHSIATDQATKAYLSSRFAMVVGLVIMIVAFFAGWQLNAQGDRLFIGSVAAIGTAFTTYLSRTFMQTYERALQQLNQYFNQPVLNGYFLSAERIAASLPAERQADVLERVVQDVLESAKEMHRNTAAEKAVTAAAKPPRRRSPKGQHDTVPQQQPGA